MSRMLVLFVLVTVLLCTCLSSYPWLFVEVKATNGFPVHNLNTGLNYATIQSAINAIQTEDGHTIKVDAGAYNETLTINKGISLIGDSPTNTVINASHEYAKIEVLASHVKVTNFSIIGMVFIQADYCTISHNIISIGGLSVESSHNTIQSNTIKSGGGIKVSESKTVHNSTIIENDIYNNNKGIDLRSFCGCDHYTLIGNLIHNNSYGLVLSGTEHISLENSIYNNAYALYLTDTASDNRIYHNDFFNNSKQVLLPFPYGTRANFWDNGNEGNYWDDYNGTDGNSDGIGDIPYVIDSYNQDNFPLMGEFHNYHITHIEPSFTLTLISNSTISNFDVGVWIEHPENRIIIFNVTGETGYGFCRLCIPKNLMATPYTVMIDNGQTPVIYYNETLFDNSTHRWIYFAYQHSEHEVIIILEFPSFLILSLFMIATLLAVIVYKRKHC